MTSSGPEPPSEVVQSDPPTSFFGAGNTAVFVDPEAADYSGGNHLDGDDDELDSEFVPQPRRRLGKLTAILAALLVAGGGFLAGVQVQKHQTTTSTASAFARRGAGTGTGFGGGAGFGGGGGSGSGTSSASGSSTSSIPAVIGQIVSVSGETVVVRNLGGKLITVKLAGTTTITQVATAADLKAGQNVTVSGTTAADGTVTATAVGTR